MLNKTGVKRFALAMIIKAFQDLHLKGEGKNGHNRRNRESACNFFKSDLSQLCADILGVNDLNRLYETYKEKKIKIRKYYKKRKKYHRRRKAV